MMQVGTPVAGRLLAQLDPEAEIRLFCLPYAGGAAANYRHWRAMLPRRIDLCPVELPGRGRRIGEPPFIRLTSLVRALADGLEAAADRPFALFGHSMGGLLAFELTRLLRQRQLRQPDHLFVSAMAAPGIPPVRQPIHEAPDEVVKKYLRDINGTPPDLLHNNELMSIMLPTLRADFSVLETYQYRQEPKLSVPITVFGGQHDPVAPPESLTGWRTQSDSGCRIRLFPGDHFYLNHRGSELLEEIRAVLR